MGTSNPIDDAVECGRILERYEDPRLRPLSPENFRIYDAARKRIYQLSAAHETPVSDEAAARARLLESVVMESSAYLDSNNLNYIGAGSKLHQSMRYALTAPQSAVTTGERQCTGCGDSFDEHGRVKS